MDQFYKKESNLNKNDIDFQIIEWHAQDESEETDESESNCNDRYTIRCYGVTDKGHSICCKITDFAPFYYIKVPRLVRGENFNRVHLQKFLNFIKESWIFKKKVETEDGETEWVDYYSDCLLTNKCTIVSKKDLYGFKNGKEYLFVKLVFNNATVMNKSKYIFKKAVTIDGINRNPIKYKLYESNFEPFMRFCHIKDILMAGWIKLPKECYHTTEEEATTQIEVSIHWNNVITLRDHKAIANFLQASWDIETYSCDGAFPDPNLKDKRYASGTSNDIEKVYPNVIYQIATTFKYYSDTKVLVKHLLTLKHCSKITPGPDNVPVVVEECKSERDLILRWAKIISKMDPDIMYTYNGDTFDCNYLYERAKLYRIEKKVAELLSRSTNIPTSIKHETFSSSAYGDSDFLRFYIPGRLNYDLLIHYKRGMKKYPSYKLDYIANEILGEGKHEVTAKEIFEYYRNGTPDQIKIIAEYCIVDTELLQKLVDTQLILITIIQLSNVTYVPISFLTTRGQTIKVFSQLLRKARQMGFLVPHTNFNEDSYPINIKCKVEHGLEDDHIGEYIEINCGRSQSGNGRDFKFNGKITEILNETEFVVLSDTEITHDYFNAKYTQLFGRNRTPFYIMRLYSSDDLSDDTFTGATVLEAQNGIYRENISVLDFASLYPTIMISRNLCYSTFVFDNRYLGIKGVNYERIAWDDQIEYRLKHNCSALGKSGINKGNVCGKQAFFEVSLQKELEHYQTELEQLKNELSVTNDKDSLRKIKTKIRTKERDLVAFKEYVRKYDTEAPRYFCRIHDPIKTSRDPSEKYQKKDVSYDYTIVQPHLEKDPETGELVKRNLGVIPALLEELYSERKKIKKEMVKAAESGNKVLEDILNSTQLCTKIALNSCYGFLGRRQGNLILKELGSIVTAVGRNLISASKEYAEGPFLDYIKQNNLVTQTIKFDKNALKTLSEKDRDQLLRKYKVN